MRPRAARSTSDGPPLPRASAELSNDGAKPHAAHACSRLGRWRGQRLQGTCNLGAGPGEEKLAAVTQYKIKVPRLDAGRKKELE